MERPDNTANQERVKLCDQTVRSSENFHLPEERESHPAYGIAHEELNMLKKEISALSPESHAKLRRYLASLEEPDSPAPELCPLQKDP